MMFLFYSLIPLFASSLLPPVSVDVLTVVKRDLSKSRAKNRVSESMVQAAESIYVDARAYLIENGSEDIDALEKVLNEIDKELLLIKHKSGTLAQTEEALPALIGEHSEIAPFIDKIKQAFDAAKQALKDEEYQTASRLNQLVKFSWIRLPIGEFDEEIRRINLKQCSLLTAAIQHRSSIVKTREKVIDMQSALSYERCKSFLGVVHEQAHRLSTILVSRDLAMCKSQISLIDENMGFLRACVDRKHLSRRILNDLTASVSKLRSQVDELAQYFAQKDPMHLLVRANEVLLQIASFCSEEKFDLALKKIEFLDLLLAKIANDEKCASHPDFKSKKDEAEWWKTHIPLAIQNLATYDDFKTSIDTAITDAQTYIADGNSAKAIEHVRINIWRCYVNTLELMKGRLLCCKLEAVLEEFLTQAGINKVNALSLKMPEGHEFSPGFINRLDK